MTRVLEAPFPVAQDISAEKIRPRHDVVVVRPDGAATSTRSGLALPSGAVIEQRLSGVVLAVGPGRRNEQRNPDAKRDSPARWEIELVEGDRVIFHCYGAIKIELEDRSEVLLIRDSDILARVGPAR